MEVSSSTASHEDLMDEPHNHQETKSYPTTMYRPLIRVKEYADEARIKLRHRILNSKNYRKPLNILLVGVVGVGKSSLINSMIRAILKKYGQWAKSGSSAGAGRAKITALLQRINSFYPDRDDPELLDLEERLDESDSEDLDDDEQAILLRMAPRIIDVCGLANENNPAMREVLRLLMYGHIPTGANVPEAYALGVNKGVAALRTEYPTGDPDLLVHRVVFVHAATDTDFPAELVNAVMATAQPFTSEEDGLMCKRTVPQFGLITMADLIDKMDKTAIKKYESMRSNFLDLLAFRGNTNRFTVCGNYHSELDRGISESDNNPNIDEKLLGFMYELCDRTIKVDHPNFQLKFEPTFNWNDIRVLIILVLLVSIGILLQIFVG